MGQIQLLLHALGYSKVNQFDIRNQDLLRELVIWLENMKVREYEIDERKALADIKSPNWDAAYQNYLADMQCPLPYESSSAEALLEWLLRFAVQVEYQDRADEYNQQASISGRGAQPVSGEPDVFVDLANSEVGGTISSIAAALHLNASLPLVDQLRLIRSKLADEVLPALSDQSLLSGASFEALSLGFSTGDALVDTAAKVLRLLYIKDLRRLQTEVDNSIVEVQEYTANPKTDASLGKTGV